MNKFVHVVAALALLAGCTSTPKRDVAPAQTAPDKVSVLTFNVENLFDPADDPIKNDETFMPVEAKTEAILNKCRTRNRGRYMFECLEKNWSPAIIRRKMQRLTHVVEQVEDGKGPDILILQEVENEAIVKRWRDDYLAHMGYKTVAFVEGPDERGIDTAVLSRLPLAGSPSLHEIDFANFPEIKEDPEIKAEDVRASRGILEAPLELPNGQRLSVFAVHFPSQGAPTVFRRAALARLLEVTAAVPKGTQVLVGGDFNITGKEDWKYKYYDRLAAERFGVSHMMGCFDCTGSVYFPPDQTWSWFDVLLFSRELENGKSGWQVDPSTIRVVNTSKYQVSRWGSPARFGTGKGAVGVSDHWPVYAEIKLVPEQKVGAKE